jgi:large subunit ribosomal protein L18
VNEQKEINLRRQRRRYHVRNKMRGQTARPRLAVHRSLKHIYCQLIDDTAGKTLAAASTLDEAVRGQIKYGGNKAAAAVVGKSLAERALAAGITQVWFDRGHCKYHGRVAALADAAREAGLEF